MTAGHRSIRSGSRRRLLPVVAIAVSAGLLASLASASAGQVKIVCAKEDWAHPDSGGPLTVTYDGGDRGTIVVKGPHADLTLPATTNSRTGTAAGMTISTTHIYGGAETTTAMPDLAAVEACAVAKIQPGLRTDIDVYILAAQSCVGKMPMGAVPTPVKASVALDLISTGNDPKPEISVAVKRSYLAKSSAPNGRMDIDMLAADCKLVP